MELEYRAEFRLGQLNDYGYLGIYFDLIKHTFFKI